MLLLTGNKDEGKKEASGGRIFTATDMPGLEELLEQLDIVTAVIEKPVPVMPHETHLPRSGDELRKPSFALMLVLGGFPAATSTAGVVMMVGALAGPSAVSNAYVALFLILAGIGLGATAWAAIRESGRA